MDAVTKVQDVLTIKEGAAGRLRLNRPQALHSLNRQMVRDMAAALHEWRDDPEVRIILIDHTEGRGFCAGGDVVGRDLTFPGSDPDDQTPTRAAGEAGRSRGSGSPAAPGRPGPRP